MIFGLLLLLNLEAQIRCSMENRSEMRKFHAQFVEKKEVGLDCRAKFYEIRKCCVEWDQSCSGLASLDLASYQDREKKYRSEKKRAAASEAQMDVRFFSHKLDLFMRVRKSCSTSLKRCERSCKSSAESTKRKIKSLRKELSAIHKNRQKLVKAGKLTSKLSAKVIEDVNKKQSEINKLNEQAKADSRLARACSDESRLAALRTCYEKKVDLARDSLQRARERKVAEKATDSRTKKKKSSHRNSIVRFTPVEAEQDPAKLIKLIPRQRKAESEKKTVVAKARPSNPSETKKEVTKDIRKLNKKQAKEQIQKETKTLPKPIERREMASTESLQDSRTTTVILPDLTGSEKMVSQRRPASTLQIQIAFGRKPAEANGEPHRAHTVQFSWAGAMIIKSMLIGSSRWLGALASPEVGPSLIQFCAQPGDCGSVKGDL